MTFASYDRYIVGLISLRYGCCGGGKNFKMSLSLGEKFRAAREQRGISISEVAEQTRISPLYLEAIDADNYKTLPGGIFNKGFVRSYAKYVGVDEQEALQDYSRMVAETEPPDNGEFKAYRPEVLTDDRTASSIVPTAVFAAVILGLMTAGILFLVNYIQNQQSEPPIAANSIAVNTNLANTAAVNSAQQPVQTAASGSFKVEFAAVGDAISLISVTERHENGRAARTGQHQGLRGQRKPEAEVFEIEGAVCPAEAQWKSDRIAERAGKSQSFQYRDRVEPGQRYGGVSKRCYNIRLTDRGDRRKHGGRADSGTAEPEACFESEAGDRQR